MLEDLVVQIKARERTAALVSVLTKPSFCMYITVTVLNVFIIVAEVALV